MVNDKIEKQRTINLIQLRTVVPSGKLRWYINVTLKDRRRGGLRNTDSQRRSFFSNS